MAEITSLLNEKNVTKVLNQFEAAPVSFWGGRKFQVKGYTGKLSYRDLLNYVDKNLNEISSKEQLNTISKKLSELDQAADYYLSQAGWWQKKCTGIRQYLGNCEFFKLYCLPQFVFNKIAVLGAIYSKATARIEQKEAQDKIKYQDPILTQLELNSKKALYESEVMGIKKLSAEILETNKATRPAFDWEWLSYDHILPWRNFLIANRFSNQALESVFTNLDNNSLAQLIKCLDNSSRDLVYNQLRKDVRYYEVLAIIFAKCGACQVLPEELESIPTDASNVEYTKTLASLDKLLLDQLYNSTTHNIRRGTNAIADLFTALWYLKYTSAKLKRNDFNDKTRIEAVKNTLRSIFKEANHIISTKELAKLFFESINSFGTNAYREFNFLTSANQFDNENEEQLFFKKIDQAYLAIQSLMTPFMTVSFQEALNQQIKENPLGDLFSDIYIFKHKLWKNTKEFNLDKVAWKIHPEFFGYFLKRYVSENEVGNILDLCGRQKLLKGQLELWTDKDRAGKGRMLNAFLAFSLEWREKFFPNCMLSSKDTLGYFGNHVETKYDLIIGNINGSSIEVADDDSTSTSTMLTQEITATNDQSTSTAQPNQSQGSNLDIPD